MRLSWTLRYNAVYFRNSQNRRIERRSGKSAQTQPRAPERNCSTGFLDGYLQAHALAQKVSDVEKYTEGGGMMSNLQDRPPPPERLTRETLSRSAGEAGLEQGYCPIPTCTKSNGKLELFLMPLLRQIGVYGLSSFSLTATHARDQL